MLNSDYIKGYENGWNEAITEIKLTIYKLLEWKQESYKEYKLLNRCFRKIEELEGRYKW